MRDIWLVIKHDTLTTFRQRSFWVLTLLMPMLLITLNAFSIIQAGRQDTGTETDGTGSSGAETAVLPAIGLVDDAKIIAGMPAGFPDTFLVPFANQDTARAALEAGEIAQYVHIPGDYIQSGHVTVYTQNYQLLRSGENMGVAFGSDYEWMLRYVLDYNLTGNEQKTAVMRNPVPGALAEYHALNPEESGSENHALAEVVASVMPYLYYFVLVIGGNYLMRSVVAEKENRTVEVLVLSLPPRRLMMGKILAMSIVTLVQVVVWAGGGILILNRGADLLNVAQFSFPPGFWVWAILFLIFGYLLFASLMAAAGTIAPNAREAGQVTWLLVVPLMPTLMFARNFLDDPDGTLSLVLSLFPFSAPSAMVTRLAVAPVPLWQIVLSLTGLAAMAYLFVWLSGRFFQEGNLISQESFNWRRFATGWREAKD